MVSLTHEHHDWLRKRKFETPVRKEQVEGDWKPRGFSCNLFVDPPGQPEREFKHKNNDELIVLVAGSLEVTISGDRVRLQPGDEVFVPGGVQHNTTNTGDTVAEWLYGYG